MGREESREGDILFVSLLVRLPLFYGRRVRGLFNTGIEDPEDGPDTFVRIGDKVTDGQC